MQQTANQYDPLRADTFAYPARNVALLGVMPGMHVADFGAGSGAYTMHLAQAVGQEGRVYAIDIQKDLLRRIHNEARERNLKNVHIIWADLEKPNASKIADGLLQMVLISNLLFQIEDRFALLTEARRILNPMGTLAIIDWSDSFGGLGPHRNDVITGEVALRLSRKAGFDFVSAFAAGEHHWGIIVRPRVTY